MATLAGLRRLLSATSLPKDLIDEFLSETNSLWLLGVPDPEVAGELVLCHPGFQPEEVRAAVKATDDPGSWRVTLATADRPGLLARTAGVFTSEGLSITHAAGTVLPGRRVALLRMTVAEPAGASFDNDEWDRIGQRLQDLHGERPPLAWLPRGPVTVDAQPQGSGRVVVTVEAPDGSGLLQAITANLTLQGCDVEACRCASQDGTAKDMFVVVGELDPAALSTAIGGSPPVRAVVLPFPARLALALGYSLAALPWRLGSRIWRQLTRPRTLTS